MIAFCLILAVGISLTAYSIVSPRRNPPMKKCITCNGDGILWPSSTPGPRICSPCGGDGWVES